MSIIDNIYHGLGWAVAFVMVLMALAAGSILLGGIAMAAGWFLVWLTGRWLS